MARTSFTLTTHRLSYIFFSGKNAIGKKQYSIRMVSQETSDALSGFEHNAVTPIGMVTPVPVLLSHHIKKLPEGRLWLGGGEVDVKMSVDVAEFVEKFVPGGRPCEFHDVTE
jgi:prolyl-tRNA editing enzyme YbaK/EbsC (Cys-tRNA(Pro) deacylase)